MTVHPDDATDNAPGDGDDDPAVEDGETAKAEGVEDDGDQENGDTPRHGESLLSGIDFSLFAPKFDYSLFVPEVDLSALAPKCDATPFLPRIDLGPLFDAAALAPKTDYSVFVPKVDFSAFFGGIDFANLLAGIDLSRFQGIGPPNWPLDPDLDVVAEVISDDGIPLVWVASPGHREGSSCRARPTCTHRRLARSRRSTHRGLSSGPRPGNRPRPGRPAPPLSEPPSTLWRTGTRSRRRRLPPS